MNNTAIIAFIGSIVPVINMLVGFVTRTIETLKRDKELTPEEEEQLDAFIASIDKPAWWKTDAELGEPGTTP